MESLYHDLHAARNEWDGLVVLYNQCDEVPVGHRSIVATLSQTNHVTTLERAWNGGFPQSQNDMIALSNSEYIALINDDVLLPKGYLSKLCHTMDERPGAAIISGARSTHRGRFDWTKDSGVEGGPRFKGVGDRYALADWVDSMNVYLDGKYGNDVVGQPMLPFYHVVIRRSALEQVGLLDEEFGWGQVEDRDLCKRFHDAGLGVLQHRGCFLFHYQHSTIANTPAFEKSGEYEEYYAGKHRINDAKPKPVSKEEDPPKEAPPPATDTSPSRRFEYQQTHQDLYAALYERLQSGLVMDIGCGTGWFLNYALERNGVAVEGIGLESNLGQMGMAQLRCRQQNVSFLPVRLEDLDADIPKVSNVVLIEPQSVANLRMAWLTLDTNGKLLVALRPNQEGMVADIQKAVAKTEAYVTKMDSHLIVEATK